MMKQVQRRGRWLKDIDRLMHAIKECPAKYRPTNYWGPGVERLLEDIEQEGFASFKRWRSARGWFYPTYGTTLDSAVIDEIFELARKYDQSLPSSRLRSSLRGIHEARRDFHVAQLAWNQERWPFDLTSHGESGIGKPLQRYRLTGDDRFWTRPYLNYLLCLTALSHHVERPPRSFLEIGGGFGVLGEILSSRDPEVRYVDCDIPPLVTVAARYLSRVTAVDITLPSRLPRGEFVLGASGCLPSWRLPDLRDDFEVFVNSYSFQEMEPDVVANYIDLVSDRGIQYVVSLNSREGKRTAQDGSDGGAVDPVTSQFVIDRFAEKGFDAVGRYGQPLIVSAGELVVLKRRSAE